MQASRVAQGCFNTTHWSVVIAAGEKSSAESLEALQKLCSDYWYPLYAFVRRSGRKVEDAQDLTQEFFRRLLERNYFANACPQKGRFRTFLLTALQRFLISEWRGKQAMKRGGQSVEFWDGAAAEDRYQSEPATSITPERLYEKRWACRVLEQVLEKLREEAVSSGKLELFEGLRSLLWSDREEVSYAQLSERLSISQGALRIAAMRFRDRYRKLLQAEIGRTLAEPEEVSQELAYLLDVLQ